MVASFPGAQKIFKHLGTSLCKWMIGMLQTDKTYVFLSFNNSVFLNGHATWCTQVLKYGRSSRRQLRVQLIAAVTGFHVYHRVWLHLGQHLSAEREHGNTEHHFAITVREHSDTRADEDVDDRPIARHLP